MLQFVRAAVLVDGTGAPPIEDGGVLIDTDGRIVAAAPFTEVRDHPAAALADVRHYAEHTLIPGLIDGHVHIAHARPGESASAELIQAPAQRSAFALAAVQAALAAGVTTVRDTGAIDGVTLELRHLLAAGVTQGARLLACGPLITTTGGHGEYLGVTADTVDELRYVIRSLASRRPDAIKVAATGGTSDPHTNRRQPNYTEAELRALVQEAERFGLAVVAHCNATEGIRRSVAAGVEVIAHCNFLSAEEGRLDRDMAVAETMLERGTYVDMNLPAAMVPLADYDAAREDRSGLPPYRWQLLGEMGLADRVFFSSDAHGPRVREFPALLAAAATLWGLPAEELVWRATGLVAKAIGIDGDSGSLEPGKVADLVVLDGDLRGDPSALERAYAVFQAGRMVAGNRCLTLASL